MYFDQCGILRCKGRIGNANLPSETANPVLLPTHHHLTNLLIKEVHARMMHGGVVSTLTAIRYNYWIPRGREVVKRRCLFDVVWFVRSTLASHFRYSRHQNCHKVVLMMVHHGQTLGWTTLGQYMS